MRSLKPSIVRKFVERSESPNSLARSSALLFLASPLAPDARVIEIPKWPPERRNERIEKIIFYSSSNFI